MKLGLLLPTNIYFCPYVKIYTDIFDKYSIQYDIIYPDKRGLNKISTILSQAFPSPYGLMAFAICW